MAKLGSTATPISTAPTTAPTSCKAAHHPHAGTRPSGNLLTNGSGTYSYDDTRARVLGG